MGICIWSTWPSFLSLKTDMLNEIHHGNASGRRLAVVYLAGAPQPVAGAGVGLHLSMYDLMPLSYIYILERWLVG